MINEYVRFYISNMFYISNHIDNVRLCLDLEFLILYNYFEISLDRLIITLVINVYPSLFLQYELLE